MTQAPSNPRLFPAEGREVRDRERGVLPSSHIRELVREGVVAAEDPVETNQLQPASLDLRLGSVAYQVRASFLPGRQSTVVESMGDLLMQEFDLTDGAVLQPGSVYIIRLVESLNLRSSELSCKANPKSTTGRLDVFARLITDYADRFDEVEREYRGPLYVEVTPKTFGVKVRRGTRLNQLRIRRSVGSEFHASRKAARLDQLLWDHAGEPIQATIDEGIWFSVDLQGIQTGDIVGWKARRNSPVIDMECIGCYEPADFWDPVHRTNRLILEVGSFYILGSRERVAVPPGFAAEMLAYDEAMGEFRVHYAGFFDPGFGYVADGPRGTRAVLEVRSHEVPYALNDGQRVGRLQFEEMLAVPEQLYGAGAGSNYQQQGLGLSKQFKR